MAPLAVLFLGALAVRLWFLDGRWVNPDEGAHLMNGLLVLEGYVPGVDFTARQPLYGYFLGLWLKVVGVDYEAARLYPVLATLGIGALVYLIGSRLFERRVALLSAAVYLFLPFTVVYGTHVKTEPLTVFLSSAGVLAVLAALERQGAPFLMALAGALFALAYYVRQSALAMVLFGLVAVVIVLRQRGPVLRGAAGLGAGFTVVCAAVMAGYATLLPLREVVAGSLNPAAFVADSVRPVVGILGEAAAAVGGGGGDAFPGVAGSAQGDGGSAGGSDARVDQAWSVTVRNVVRTVKLNSPLVLGLLLSALPLAGAARHAVRGTGEPRERARALLWIWFGASAAAYAFFAVARGFFPAYFGEMLPPLAILTALVVVWAVDGLRRSDEGGRRALFVFGVVAAGAVALHTALGPEAINRPLYFVAVPAAVAVLHVGWPGSARFLWAVGLLAVMGAATVLAAGRVGTGPTLLLYGVTAAAVFGVLFSAFRLHPRRDAGRLTRFTAYSLLMATAVMWLGTSQARLDRSFDGVWSPATVSEVSDFLVRHTRAGDPVISGAVIWEFQAQRLPFRRVSHPLAYRPGMADERRRELAADLDAAPPPVVVLDGYTEQTWLPNLPWMLEMLEEDYELARVVEGGRYPVQVFRRRPG